MFLENSLYDVQVKLYFFRLTHHQQQGIPSNGTWQTILLTQKSKPVEAPGCAGSKDWQKQVNISIKVLRKPTFVKTRNHWILQRSNQHKTPVSKKFECNQYCLLTQRCTFFFTWLKTKLHLLFCRISFPLMTNPNFSSPEPDFKMPCNA